MISLPCRNLTMRPFILVVLAGILALTSSVLHAADVKPIVVNPSTGLNTTIQPGMRLSVPTATGGFLVTLDPGVQTGTQVFSFPIVAAGQTLAILGAQTFTGEQTLQASTTGAAPLNIPQGTAPTSPVNGDVWTTVAGLFARINGTTVGPFAAAAGSGFPVSTTTYAVQDATDATKQQKWNLASSSASTILTLKGQQSTSQTLAFPNVTGSDTLATLGLANVFTAKNTFPATTTGAASINLPAGTAPTSPVDGDVWTTTAGVFARINGGTVGPFNAGGITGTLVSGRVPFANGTSSLTDSAIMTFSTANGLSVNKNTAFRSEFFGSAAGNNTLTGTSLTVVGGTSGQGLTNGANDTIVGSQAANILTSGGKNVIVGDSTAQTLTTGSSNILLGTLADTDTSSRSNAFVAGSINGTNIADVWFGNGIAAPSPLAYLVHGTAGSGTDIAGGSITLAGGQGTGAGLGGPITFQTALATTTGTGANSLVEVARVTQGKNVLVGTTTDITGTFGLAVAGTTDASSSTTGAVQISGGVGIAKKLYVGTEIFTPASNTTNAGITLPPGSAPSAPVNGDLWTTTTGLFARINGSTVGPYSAITTPLASTLGGTGVNNAGTLTNATNTTITGGGTLALGGFTATIPATGTVALLSANTFTGEQTTVASTTTSAGLNLPHGSAPTSPVNGDFWTTTAGFFGRVNGSTVGPFAAAATAAWPVSTTTYAVQDSGDATKQQLWNLASSTTGTNLTLKGQQTTSQTIAFPNVTASDTVATLGVADLFTAPAQTAVAPPSSWSFTGGAHTALTAGSIGAAEFLVDLGQVKQWTGGSSVTGYVAMNIKPPTLAATSATTFSNPATLNIAGAPIAGTNGSVSAGVALNINGGGASISGQLKLTSASTNMVANQASASSGLVQQLTFTGSAVTGQTAGGNITQVAFNYGQTEQHATGSVAVNQTILMTGPTLSAVAASTTTTADTLAVSAPIAGTNMTVTTANAIHATSGQIQADGNISLASIGSKLLIKEGTNASLGVATLTLGTVTVSNTLVTANSRIMLSIQSLGTVSLPTVVGVTARSAGTSFTITSASATDTSVVAWQIIEPAP